MFLKIIMGITNLILILVFYYVTTPAIDKRRGKYFGISLDISQNNELLSFVEKYKKYNNSLLYILLLLIVFSCISKNSTYILLAHVLIVVACFVGFYGNMIKYTMKFDELILNNDEIMDKLKVKKTRKVDLYLSSKAEEYKFTKIIYNLFLPIIICIWLVVKILNAADVNNIEHSYQFLYIIILFINIILIFTSIIATKYIKKSRQISYTENSDKNAVLNFNKKNRITRIVYIINNLTIIGNFLFAIMFIKSAAFAISILVIVSVLSLVLIVHANKKIKNIEYLDDEALENWVYGIFYYNKSDQRLNVNQRFGIGTTINMAKPLGKFIGLMTAAFVVIIYSYMMYTVIGNEVIGSKLLLTDEKIHITSLDYSDSVFYSDIDSIELINKENINILLKTNGIGTEKYSRGYYDVKDLGNCFLCIYDSSSLVILIKSESGNIIYSEETKEETKHLYNTLRIK